jgi:hypothetical protein
MRNPTEVAMDICHRALNARRDSRTDSTHPDSSCRV